MDSVRADQPYSLLSRGFHWVTALLVLVAFLVSVGGPESRIYSQQNSFSLGLHELLGLTVFILTALRLVARIFDPPPPAVEMPGWMHSLSRLVHWVLFTLLIITPLSAIWAVWAEGHALTPLGLGTLSPMIAKAADFGSTLADIHGLLGDAIMWVAGLHGAAALYHHFWLRDAVLTAMVPWLRPK